MDYPKTHSRFFIFLTSPISVQDSSRENVIGTRVVPPFVIKENGEYTGLSVTLWEHVADELDLDYQFEETDIRGMIDGVSDNSYYASTSALTITSERESVVDFTHPYFGICGEHGGEPHSVTFCYQQGLNYVSCLPFRVPVARLAAAQAALSS